MKPQFLISSVSPGSGKTIFTMGLIRTLRRKGMKIQPYKCGSELTDSQFLSLSSDYETINLDSWITTPTRVQHSYNKYGEKADVCIVEGNGALFDGYKRTQGSSIEMAKLLSIPVILLVNARIAGYSIAPIIYGFKHFQPKTPIVGVIFNQITSTAHYTYLKEACTDAGIACLGYLPWNTDYKLPPKHSSVTLTTKRELDILINQIANDIEKYVNISLLLNYCNRNFPCQYTLPYNSDIETETIVFSEHPIKIAIARDPAFNFIYKENISQLAQKGNITYFSPVYGNELPEADFIYLPGGYPELFARQLHRRHKMMMSLKEYAEKGGKIFAEGGGMVFLGNTLTVKEGGSAYQMSGILPLNFTTINHKLNSGYRKITYKGIELKGYEFHYSNIESDTKSIIVSEATNLKGMKADLPLYRYKNVIASYGQWYWGDQNLFDWWK